MNHSFKMQLSPQNVSDLGGTCQKDMSFGFLCVSHFPLTFWNVVELFKRPSSNSHFNFFKSKLIPYVEKMYHIAYHRKRLEVES